MIKIEHLISFIVLLLALPACTAQINSVPPSLTTTPPRPTQSLVFSPTDISTLAVPFIPPQPTPQNIIGGGTVQDGPFSFDMRLFLDPTMNQQPIATSLYSDLNGIGAYMYWFYQGSDIIGPVETYWGTLPSLDQLQQDTYPSISHGSSGGRIGGILLPGDLFLSGESKVGDHILVGLKVVTPQGKYGGVLGFTLKQGVNGFEPTNISIDVLQLGG